VNTLKSAVLTLKSVITHAEMELKKCDKAMEYRVSGKWKAVSVAAKQILQPHVDEEARMEEERERESRSTDRSSGTASKPSSSWYK